MSEKRIANSEELWSRCATLYKGREAAQQLFVFRSSFFV